MNQDLPTRVTVVAPWRSFTRKAQETPAMSCMKGKKKTNAKFRCAKCGAEACKKKKLCKAKKSKTP